MHSFFLEASYNRYQRNTYIYRTAVKKGHFKQVLDLHCNVTLKGNYNVTANTTVLFGPGSEGLLKADGIGKVKLGKKIPKDAYP